MIKYPLIHSTWSKDEFKAINKVVKKMINRFGHVQVVLKNKPKINNPFDGLDVLIEIG